MRADLSRQNGSGLLPTAQINVLFPENPFILLSAQTIKTCSKLAVLFQNIHLLAHCNFCNMFREPCVFGCITD